MRETHIESSSENTDSMGSECNEPRIGQSVSEFLNHCL
jgi:hypothetical protein